MCVFLYSCLMYIDSLLLNIMTSMQTSDVLHHNGLIITWRDKALLCHLLAWAFALRLDSNPRTTQSIMYDSIVNHSSDVWCDGAIVISSDSEVGPIIRRTIISHDWLRLELYAQAGFSPMWDSLRQFVWTSAGLAGILVASVGVLLPLRYSLFHTMKKATSE